MLLRPISDLFHHTIDEDVKEIMGQDVVVCSSNASTESIHRNIDLNICLLLQHGKMTLKEMASNISTIMKTHVHVFIISDRMGVLNNDKQRICFDRDNGLYYWI